jgi:hypothetical protein
MLLEYSMPLNKQAEKYKYASAKKREEDDENAC